MQRLTISGAVRIHHASQTIYQIFIQKFLNTGTVHTQIIVARTCQEGKEEDRESLAA